MTVWMAKGAGSYLDRLGQAVLAKAVLGKDPKSVWPLLLAQFELKQTLSLTSHAYAF